MTRTFNNSLVKKSWGSEYLMYRNSKVSVWLLKIDHNKRTSMHAHPRKNTGLIVIDGVAKVAFLKNSINLKRIDKVMIFRGTFHQTEALSKNGVVVLEVETPEDKKDLVRLSDDYGRENQGYETEENYSEIPSDCLTIPSDTVDGFFETFKTSIRIYKPKKEELINKDFETAIVFLDGGIVSNNDLLVQPGDVVSVTTLDILLEKFNLSPDSLIMEITKLDR